MVMLYQPNVYVRDLKGPGGTKAHIRSNAGTLKRTMDLGYGIVVYDFRAMTMASE